MGEKSGHPFRGNQYGRGKGWTSAGSTGSKGATSSRGDYTTSAAINKVKNLPAVDPDDPDVIETPFEFSGSAAQKAQDEWSVDLSTAVTKTVKVSDLIALQTRASRSDVLKKIETPNEEEIHIIAGPKSKFYLWDGHHRAIAAWAQNKTEIKAKVVRKD